MSEDTDKNKLPEDEENEAAAPPPMDIEVELVGADEGSADDEAQGEEGSGLLGKGKLSVKEDKTFGMLSHLLGAFTAFVGPLIIWMIKKEDSPFVEDQGKEALNFQITITIAYVVATILGMIPFVACLTFMLYPAIWVVGVVFAIMGCLKANEGELYRYPYTLRLIK
ncbi:MAG: DUF4870 domain-containing protein [Verrucomicrobiales bacterium]|nr:DUF4870 domain-containing protein [Verrucomicrobiales bacterium]